MNNGRICVLFVGIILLIGLVVSSLFVVNQWEMAIKLQFGKIVDSDYEPGLHFKIPVIQNVKKFDGRIQTMDSNPERFLTIEKKDVIVNSYAKWRITNAAQYFRSTGDNVASATRLLSERINTSLRDEFGKRTIQEVISGERAEIMALLTKDADEKAAELGIEVLDVRVKQIDLPKEVSQSVYDRMRAERERVASELRAQGAEAAERIRANADAQRVVILANAYKVSEETRGEGDGLAAEIYAKAFQENEEFYAFYRSLNAYGKTFNSSGNMMVLDPDSEFFRYFRNAEGKQ
ncbi:protease modulator HflC [Sedimenticola selenatireducens]|uniref:Protein HflC n=1 Tax=Sedimenticola selenatireducens TaxID=191960 RepID=A0A2N6CVP9_9GAMM|nr:protease modulator HflC [Sedimenticola selenatireducens]PLX61280.1 MAG: protease modulator HflC [Sedimenticola selenatireducens]